MWASLVGFVEKALDRGSQADSRIVLALDLHCRLLEGCQHSLFMKSVSLLNSLRNLVAGVKIGWPTILTLGEEALYRLINEYDWGFFFIADLKLADVGHINRIVIEHMADIGFDAVISHSMIGREKALDEAVSTAHRNGLGILSVVAMSHPGGEEILNKCFVDALRISLEAGVDGFILPATMPKYIEVVRERGFRGLIFSPGVGAQGAEAGSAVSRGADFEIIGRGIYKADDPVEAAKGFLERLRW